MNGYTLSRVPNWNGLDDDKIIRDIRENDFLGVLKSGGDEKKISKILYKLEFTSEPLSNREWIMIRISIRLSSLDVNFESSLIVLKEREFKR